MKRFILIFLILTAFCVDAGAVLKEKDLEQTLSILQAELEQYNNDLTVRSAARRERTKRLITQLLQTMKRSDQNSLMLYSQKLDYVFDLTYRPRADRDTHRRSPLSGRTNGRKAEQPADLHSWHLRQTVPS